MAVAAAPMPKPLRTPRREKRPPRSSLIRALASATCAPFGHCFRKASKSAMTVLAATLAQASVSLRFRSSACRALSARLSRTARSACSLRRMVAFRKLLKELAQRFDAGAGSKVRPKQRFKLLPGVTVCCASCKAREVVTKLGGVRALLDEIPVGQLFGFADFFRSQPSLCLRPGSSFDLRRARLFLGHTSLAFFLRRFALRFGLGRSLQVPPRREHPSGLSQGPVCLPWIASDGSRPRCGARVASAIPAAHPRAASRPC